MKSHREKVGNYNIKKALEILKSGNMSEFNEAFMNLNMGINRAPKNIEGRLNLARIYVAMNRPDIAIEKTRTGHYLLQGQYRLYPPLYASSPRQNGGLQDN